MLYARAAEVAIRAALYLAGRPPGELSPVRDVARATHLSSAYLSKIIQRLAPAGLVRTFRGPGGGIQLAKSPEAITLWSLVSAIEGRAEVDRCALGLGNCSSETPCPFHKLWVPQRKEFRRLLEETTIAALLAEFAAAQVHDQQDQEFHRRTAEPSFFYQAAPERRDRP